MKQSQNPEVEGQGAMKTGYSFNNMARLQVIGYRFLDDTSLNANLKERCEKDPDLKRDLNVLTTEEVKKLVGHHISQIPQEIPVIECFTYLTTYFLCRFPFLYICVIVVDDNTCQ